jgi:uncharacterized damage-inducible protein DinB
MGGTGLRAPSGRLSVGWTTANEPAARATGAAFALALRGLWYSDRMSRSLLDDAFAHHVWATLRLIDACLALSPAQLDAAVPATDRSILATMRHVIVSDSFDLFVASGERGSFIRADRMGLAELRAAMEDIGTGWSRLLDEGIDADAVLREVDPDDGFQRHAPMGIRLAQALHHGTDHRSQICTALTTLGVEPPAVDVFSFGLQDGRVVEVPAGS